jgi:hypothetical protein
MENGVDPVKVLLAVGDATDPGLQRNERAAEKMLMQDRA